MKDKLLDDLDFQNKEIVANEPKTTQRVPQYYDNGTPLGRELVSDSHYYRFNDEY